jgi:monofunctional biosynthetic peptidoglycan transglycosylase
VFNFLGIKVNNFAGNCFYIPLKHMAKKTQRNTKSGSSLIHKISGIISRVLIWFLMVTILWVLAYRFINPPITLLMIGRNIERKSDGKSFKTDKEWVNFDLISKSMKLAAVCAEDQKFLKHMGFDVKAIERAYKSNEKGKPVKGGSTISQQTAKNVFLWPGRSWIRKGFEAYFTLLIEILWSKERILEVYLNVIEMGDGIYGAEAAAQAYYNKPASKLTKSQSAMIAACFPNPLRWTPLKPTRYIRHKQQLILRNMRNLGPLEF